MTPAGRSIGAAVALSIWIGAALLFSAIVAPAAFAVLPARALAGALVARVLPPIQIAGLVVGVLAFWLELAGVLPWRAARRAMLAILVAMTAVAQFLIDPRIDDLRQRMGPSLDALAPTDTLRVAFGQLHGISVGCLGVGMLAAAVAVVLVIGALARDRRRA